ncbi:MAG: 30S ribosomal protein S27e [Euryarchaeota archaeon]|nr:30S ribosomal protein S27e [Euryarchaeota archaeon]
MKGGKTKNVDKAFVKVKCSDCGNEQVIFLRASTVVKCHVCGATIATPTGGKADIRGEIVEVYS